MTRPDLLQYVGTLDAELQRIYEKVDRMVIENDDTGGEDFQMAADLLAAFETRAKLWWEE